eukprot:TRINITY_DN4651_c0_g1_i3.p1 TRINITY_DN4651_c0_g1~~TRINITY_DN4651_c0_g1_i3.p1  ORF type:complete len:921 (+),score=186.87 TRINITY_DN4651_c0_g1_i3:58-2820(+)
MSLLENWDYDVYDHTAVTYGDNDDVEENSPDDANGLTTAVVPKEEDAKIFRVERVEYQPTQLRQFVVSNNMCAMVQLASKIVRIDLSNPSTPQEVEVSRKPEDIIFRVFLDPTGHHLLITMENGDNYYLHSKQKQPKLLAKVKGVISAVGWNKKEGNEATTREILLGTTLGAVIEICIDNGKEKTVKQIYSLESLQVTGLHVEAFPPTPSEQRKYLIIATTPTRIYQFVGGPSFEAVFAGYENPAFHELPGEFQNSELHLFSKYQGLAKSLAWLTEPGIYHGNLVFGSQNPGDSVCTDNQLLQFPNTESATLIPISMLLTEWHFILLYPDRFQAISRLNLEVVVEEILPASGGPFIKFHKDPIHGTCWLYSANAVYEMTLHNEDRNAWRLYMEKMQFDLALQHCKDSRRRDKVLTAQADYYFSQRKMKMAATYYAKTQLPFEQIALKFVSSNEREALSGYLQEKLNSLKPTDITQRTLLCTWLVEIYLDQLNSLEANVKEKQRDLVLDEFRQFLDENKKCLNEKTVFELISSHGRVDDMLYFATIIENFERVISHHIQKGDFLSALTVMSRQYKEEIYYKFSPVLIQFVPAETVTAWISQPVKLVPSRLLPSLARYKHTPGQRNHAIYYLRYCIEKKNNRDPAIHNYLLSLYAQQEDERDLLAFLDQEDLCYDKKYALRVCREHHRHQACVKLYSSMRLFDEAIDLAITVNLDLAKEIADMPEDDEALKRRLWLKIARHVVEKERNIKKALDFLSDCSLLKIEDILPFFPDFVQIDEFKDEICRSLDEYNREISDLQREMDESTNNAEQIRQDIKDLRNRYGFIGANHKCDVCQTPILLRQFYLFPCQHVFHVDCMTREVIPHLSIVRRQRYQEILGKLQRYETDALSPKPAGGTLNDAAYKPSFMEYYDFLYLGQVNYN